MIFERLKRKNWKPALFKIQLFSEFNHGNTKGRTERFEYWPNWWCRFKFYQNLSLNLLSCLMLFACMRCFHYSSFTMYSRWNCCLHLTNLPDGVTETDPAVEGRSVIIGGGGAVDETLGWALHSCVLQHSNEQNPMEPLRDKLRKSHPRFWAQRILWRHPLAKMWAFREVSNACRL